MKKTLVVVVNGAAGVGKDTFIESAQHYLWLVGLTSSNHSSVTCVKEAAKVLGWDGVKDEKGRQFLSDLKATSTRLYDGPVNFMMKEIKFYQHDVMFFHIREPQEIARFLSMHEGSKSVLIQRDGVQGFRNQSDQDVENHSYDFTVDNNGTLRMLEAEAKRFIYNLVGIGRGYNESL